LPGCAPCCICLLRPHWCVAVVTSWEGRGRACPPLHWVRRGYDEAVRHTVPDGIPCRMGYRAGWDTVPDGILCRMGYRAGWASRSSTGKRIAIAMVCCNSGTSWASSCRVYGSFPSASSSRSL
jgi:hypothetical protein